MPIWGTDKRDMFGWVRGRLRLLKLTVNLVDWQAAAQIATDRIPAVNPNLLVIVGGMYDIEADGLT